MLLFTWPYNFDVSSQKPKSIKELPGLSPGALCRLHKSIWLEIEVHLTQSKIHVADGTVSHEALSVSNADSTLWIFKEQPIDQEIPINNKEASCLRTKPLWCWVLQYRTSPRRRIGGGWRDRTDDPLLAKQVLSQLS